LRKSIGLGPVYAAIGLFQFLQNFLSITVFISLSDKFLVNPGSTVIFTGTLFTVLLVYVKEDAAETRKLILTLIFTNIILSLLLLLISWNVNLSDYKSVFNISAAYFLFNVRSVVVGLLALILDTFILIIIFERLSKYLKSLFLRIMITMLIVISFDTLFFVIGTFWSTGGMKNILISELISKNSAVIIYTVLFFIYLRFIDKDIYIMNSMKSDSKYYALSYRQKYEMEKIQKEKVEKDAEFAIRKSQIRYQTLVDNSPVGVFLTDALGSTLYVNPKWCQISGMSQEEGLNFGWLNGLHPEDKVETEVGWVRKSGKTESSFASYRFLHKDGSVRWVLGHAVPEFDIYNNLVGYIGSITDITELKEFEDKLSKAKEEAEMSDRLKTAFIQNISHEIRTPMNAICGFSEFLRQEDLTPELRNSYITVIQNSSNQLLSIVNDILMISSLEANQIKADIEKVCINELISELLVIFQHQNTNPKINIYSVCHLNDKQSVVLTDRTKLNQILTNLLYNALKFTGSGFVEFGYILKENNLLFHVKDTGIGIREENKERVFERFYQCDITIQKNYSGTGLGLSITKGLVELLGGQIWVESIYGSGTTLYFTIPYNTP
jgi:PAS domain S-box-containing protein